MKFERFNSPPVKLCLVLNLHRTQRILSIANVNECSKSQERQRAQTTKRIPCTRRSFDRVIPFAVVAVGGLDGLEHDVAVHHISTSRAQALQIHILNN